MNQKKEAQLSDYVFGQVQPQALELEQAVLGAILTDKNVFSVVLDILSIESFYHEHHALIFKAMISLFQKSHPIDLLTITEEMKRYGDLDTIGGGYYLVELTNRVGSAANIEVHARIVSQKFLERQLIKASCEVIRDAFDPTVDTFDVMQSAEKKLFNITQSGYLRAEKTTLTLANEFLANVEAAMKRTDGLTGVPSGFTALDRVTSGWQRSDLIIVAARPGMGKSAFMLSCAINAAKFGKGVAIFSLEMSGVQLVGRMASQEAQISGSSLRSGKLHDHEWQELQKAMEAVTELPIYIDDTPSISAYEVRGKCRRLKMQNDIQMVIVDYLQLMSFDTKGDRGGGNREQEISSISRALKAMAKELDVPVIALSQLSRAVETRGGTKRPQLSDLRESGAIEQDADIVSFIYRPEYYQIVQDENGNSTKGLAEVIISKHRNGALETVGLKFTDVYAQFSDFEIGFEDAQIEEKSNQFPAIPKNGIAYDMPFEPQKILTTPSKFNDNEDLPF